MYINDHRTLKIHGENGRKLLWLYVRPQETAVISSYASPKLTLRKKYIIIIIIIIIIMLPLPGIELQSSKAYYLF
jgi:hypothetical protein